MAGPRSDPQTGLSRPCCRLPRHGRPETDDRSDEAPTPTECVRSDGSSRLHQNRVRGEFTRCETAGAIEIQARSWNRRAAEIATTLAGSVLRTMANWATSKRADREDVLAVGPDHRLVGEARWPPATIARKTRNTSSPKPDVSGLRSSHGRKWPSVSAACHTRIIRSLPVYWNRIVNGPSRVAKSGRCD